MEETYSNPRLILPNTIEDKDQYIYVPQTANFVNPNQTYNGCTQQEAIAKANSRGLTITAPKTFISYLINLREASEGKRILYDGLGNPIPVDKARTIFERHIFLKEFKLLINLDAYFQKGYGFQGLDLVTNSKIIPIENDGLRKQTDVLHLEDTLTGNEVLVDLIHESFNSQGFPIKKSELQRHEKGRNIFWNTPLEGRTPQFVAGQYRSSFYCDRLVDYSSPALGVLLSVEGTKEI